MSIDRKRLSPDESRDRALEAARQILIDEGPQAVTLRESLALRTLLMPGGLGSTHKVLILGKGVEQPALLGSSFRQRVT